MRIIKSKLFEIFEAQLGPKKIILTQNAVPGAQVYDERLDKQDGVEYREWDPSKSKLCAAIMKGCTNIFIRRGQRILYLGASTGTTISHISDMIGDGLIYGVDVAPVVLRDLVFLSEQRNNIIPILADSNHPETYKDRVKDIEIVFQDIAQKNQVEIFKKNTKMYLKKGGYAMIAIKARCIDVTKNPKRIFLDVRKELERDFTVIDYRELDPYEKDHCFMILKKNN